MSNDVKRNGQRLIQRDDGRAAPPIGPARLTLLACFVALAALLTQVPGPAEALDVLTGTGTVPTSPNAPFAAVQSMLLITAGLLAWSLAGWAVLVLGVGLFARLPGRSGRQARRLLPRIAPASVGRLVLAAAGVSLIAGTAACAAPGTPGPAAAGTSIGAWSTPSTTATSPASSTPAPGEALTIDWPDPSTSPPPATTPPPETSPTGVAGTPTPLDSGAGPATPSPTPPTPATTPAAPTAAPSFEAEPPATVTVDPGSDDAPEPPTGLPVTPAPATGPAAPETGGAPSTRTPPTEQPAVTEPSSVVTVAPGDSLWRIAAAALGPNASDEAVDNAWRAWYFVNRDEIGDDPDTILPGQHLRVPSDAGQVRP